MTISITQEHPESRKVIKLQRPEELFFRGKSVSLPTVLENASHYPDLHVTVHQTFSYAEERYPTITYSIKATLDDTQYSLDVEHKTYSARLDSMRCTIKRIAETGAATHTFPDVDRASDINATLEKLINKALQHEILGGALGDDTTGYYAQQDTAVCLN